MLILIGLLFLVVAIVGWVFILIDAFQNTLWKGIACFFCGLYCLYYGIAEFEHEQKVPILLAMIVGGIIGRACLAMAQ